MSPESSIVRPSPYAFGISASVTDLTCTRGKRYTICSVSEKQTLEIVKVLYRGADIHILDEPTAVLTRRRHPRLYNVMRNMKADGKSLVIITHKLHEVMEISDRVAVLRRGEYIGDIATEKTGLQELTNMMVGHAISLNIERPLVRERTERLRVQCLTVRDADGVRKLDKVSFTAFGGEILGVAGISAQRSKGAAGGHRGPSKLRGGLLHPLFQR
jgi:simple sugar transport system ATP-binding protein